jgi:hypothetical protein
MRRRLFYVTLLLLAVPAATAEAQLPQASQPGIRVSRSAGGRVAIAFLDTASGRRAYRRYAGKTVTIRCQSIRDHVFGTGPVGVATAKVSFRKGLSTLRLRVRGNVNLCQFGSVIVATDAAARRFLADLDLAPVILQTADRAARSGARSAVRRLGRGKGVTISNPASTPGRGRVGVYARNGAVAVAARSASGKRIFFEVQGDIARTNVLASLDQVGPVVTPRGITLPSGALPPAGTPLPAGSDPDITATRDGADAVFHFSGAARDAVAGKRVTVHCVRTSTSVIGSTGDEATERNQASSDGSTLRVRVASRYPLCSLAWGDHFARVALTDPARAALEEGLVSAALERVLRTAADAAAPGYPAATSLGDQVVALGARSDTPPDLRVGAWTDAGDKLSVVAVARTGRRLFADVDGDVLRTNAFTVPDLP